MIYIVVVVAVIWIFLGCIGDLIRKGLFHEESEPSNVLLGPICIIISVIEILIRKYQDRQDRKLQKIREQARKPLTIYEKRAIERINKLLEINN